MSLLGTGHERVPAVDPDDGGIGMDVLHRRDHRETLLLEGTLGRGRGAGNCRMGHPDVTSGRTCRAQSGGRPMRCLATKAAACARRSRFSFDRIELT